MATFTPAVFLDRSRRPLIVVRHGRTKYHAVAANGSIKLVALDTLRDLTPALLRGEPYPPKRAASYWLNHSSRAMSPRARAILRGLVARGKS